MTDDEVIAEVGGLVDEAGVCLALYGTDLDPVEVTALLGCEPTSAHRRGERRSPKSRPAESGAWLLEIRGEAPTSPEHLIRRLLMKLPADAGVWETLAARFDVQVRFGIHFTGWNKGFHLPPDVVAMITRMHAGMGFDLYGYGEQDA